ncbi:ankyrin repeat-containing domain protein, partial [Amylocarpus encephaloides]
MSDSRGNQPLYWACKKGDMNMVRRLCEAGADVNGHDDYGVLVGLTPFHGVASSGNIEMAEYLYAKSARLDMPNKRHGTPLFIATTQDSLPLVQYFLDRGADPNILGGYQELPLNAAADSGNVEMARLLVSRRAEVNPDHTYAFGNALGLAAYCGHLELVNFLLEQGCRVDVPDSVGELPLASAAQEGFNEVVEALLNYDDSPASHDQALLRSDSFAAAASKGYHKILIILTDVGISSDIMDKGLYEAADYQHDETVRVLLKMGANPDAEGEGYGNALQAACFDGSEEMVDDLLQAGADVNCVYGEDTYGTALQAAAFEGNLNIVQRLLEHGAAINIPACGKYGHPLHAACCANHPEVVEHLLDSGAEVNAVGGEWSYALVAATGNGYQACADILIARNANVEVRGGKGNSTPLIEAAMELPLSTVQAIHNRGGSVFDVDNDGDSAFTSAAASADLETLEFLLDKGSDIHLIGKWGGALYRATEEGSMECVTFLLDHDINVNQKGGECHTSLMAAACGGEVEIVKLLLERGANIHTKGGLYHTALQAAANGCNTQIVQLLLDKGAKPNDLGGRHGSPLHAAILSNCEIEMITMLVDHGADVNSVSPETGSILTLASRRADTEKIAYLLEKGADVNVRGGKYETTLQCAAYVAGLDEFQMYLDHGADPSIEGGYYGSALSAAAARGHEEITQLLLDHEKQPTAHVVTEALYYAAHFRKPEIVQKLLDKGADVLATNSGHDCAL